ncbi:hypothetical protein Pyn_26429 [Prunus yedoensis var. nudiflora]|uniref:Uncharacterized protein n=1 Tax=Prunus yedoensis var. nudiflora TaxID=2094558 RepID=A0A314ZUJ4_PRUYE|nr:hypothetical protein Pyn_26429 [Prunus yedoensis var. nudiflora]
MTEVRTENVRIRLRYYAGYSVGRVGLSGGLLLFGYPYRLFSKQARRLAILMFSFSEDCSPGFLIIGFGLVMGDFNEVVTPNRKEWEEWSTIVANP